MIGRFLGEYAKNAGYALLFGRFLQSKSGARLQNSRQIGQWLNARNTGLLIDGDQGRLSERVSFQNVCVTASVGTGKTTRYIIPNVLDKAKQNCSIVVNDPKGEVFDITSGYMQAHGFEVLVINPENLSASSFFNPLAEAKTDIEIEQVAEILIKAGTGGKAKDPIWDNGAIRLISVLLKLLQRAGYVEPGYFTLGNLYYLLQNFGQDGSPLDDFVIKWAYNPEDPNDSSLWDEWKGVITGNDKAVQSFVLTALVALKAFTNADMVKLTASSSINLEDMRKRKTIIYFITPPQLAEYYGFFTSVFFRSVFNAMMRRLPAQNDLSVFCLYDEFGHSTLPGFGAVANTIRGYRVSLSIILQSLAQLSMRYGDDYAKAIQGGFTTYMTYTASDDETSKFFERRAGRVVEKQKNKIEEMLDHRNEYNLLNADEISRIGDMEAILLSSNQQPARIETVPYFQHPRFRRIEKRYGSASLRSQGMVPAPKKVPLA